MAQRRNAAQRRNGPAPQLKSAQTSANAIENHRRAMLAASEVFGDAAAASDLQFRFAAHVELIHCLKLEVKFLQLVEPWGARLHCRDNLTQRALIDRLDKKVLMYFYISIYPSMYLTIQLSIDPSIHLSIYQSIYQSIHPSIYQSNRSS